MIKNNTDKQTLLAFLTKVLEKYPKISKANFNKIPEKPATCEVYVRHFKTWTQARTLAQKGVEPVDVKEFDFTLAKSDKLIVDLRRELKAAKKGQLTSEEIRRYIFELKDTSPTIPSWMVCIKAKKTPMHGIPTLLLSDFHMGEVIVPEQVFGVNKFNLEIARKRIHTTIANTVDILTNHLKSDYPGMVLLLNGDFVSGCIHEELLISNEKPIMPIVMEAYSDLIWVIQELNKIIPNIMVFCCHGNHGRTFKKPVHKDAALSSYDWLIYTLLERYFKDNRHINFKIASGDDVQWKVYDHGYRMTHGAQFRGGQGFLGHIAPVTRGEIRKRSAAESYGQNYDTLVVSHFHSYGVFKRTICNGSLVGYSEYSMNNNFPYERPQQALWLTHPEHHITFTCPIFCDASVKSKKQPWVSWPTK